MIMVQIAASLGVISFPVVLVRHAKHLHGNYIYEICDLLESRIFIITIRAFSHGKLRDIRLNSSIPEAPY